MTYVNCNKCGEDKPESEYYFHNGKRHSKTCKPCRRKDVQKNREAKLDYYREYDRNRGYREYDPEKARARRAVRQLSRPPGCTHCGEIGPVEGHHPDYSQPLSVVWLCKPCHVEVHTQ